MFWKGFVIVIVVLVLILIYLLWCEYSEVSLSTFQEYESYWLKDHPPPHSNETSEGLIFVSIASYRDSECPRTVQSLLSQARFPENLRIVVFEQNDPSDVKVSPQDNVKVIHTHYTNAMGPVWARYVIQREWEGEAYYLQIDSHTLFSKNWDVKCIEMLDKCGDKAVLTQYPPEYDLETRNIPEEKLRDGLYIEGFRYSDHFSRIQSEYISERPPVPFVSHAWAGCFSFSKSDIITDAPYDPYCFFLFFGEELDITLRLFTRGWKFYSPNESVVFSLFKRHYRPTYWLDLNRSRRESLEKLARIRLYKKFGWDHYIPDHFKNIDLSKTLFKDLKKYALGDKRTLKDYERFAEVDFSSQYATGNNLKKIRDRGRFKQLWLNLGA